MTAEQSEITRLRKALIDVGRKVGCLLDDRVSTDFLMSVPDEVAGFARRHRASAYLHAAEHFDELADLSLTVLETDCSHEAHLYRAQAQVMRDYAHSELTTVYGPFDPKTQLMTGIYAPRPKEHHEPALHRPTQA
jgi:hypothetical protein